MRYGSMEEAAGQYLARMLKYANIKITDDPYATLLCGGSVVTFHKQEIILQTQQMWDAQIAFSNFKAAMALVEGIKEHHTLITDQIIFFPRIEFDENILLEIIIHAVKEKYIKKAEAIDALAKLDNPRMTAEFLSETGDFDGKEDFKL